MINIEHKTKFKMKGVGTSKKITINKQSLSLLKIGETNP